MIFPLHAEVNFSWNIKKNNSFNFFLGYILKILNLLLNCLQVRLDVGQNISIS